MPKKPIKKTVKKAAPRRNTKPAAKPKRVPKKTVVKKPVVTTASKKLKKQPKLNQSWLKNIVAALKTLAR